MMLHADLRLSRPGFALEVELASDARSVLGLLGPNGSGKSTTLRCLAGLETPGAGRITIGDTTVFDSDGGIDLPPERRSIGYVFQDYLLFPHMSVLDNVAFGLRSRRVAKAEAARRSQAWLDRLGVGDLAGRRPGSLSGGQAQRVALARALVTEPRLLLLDEPLAALDAGTRSSVRSLLREHLADFAGTVVMVTHDPVDALVLADEVVVLEDGHVVQRGAPADVARRPASRYVADLVGVNLLRGAADGGTVQLEGGGDVRVADMAIRGRCIVAIRPEAISVHADEPHGSPRNVWRMRIGTVENRGDVVRLSLEGSPALTAIVTPGSVAELGLHEGREVYASVKATDLEVYPA
ncbi:MAG: ABC transporter ATP-binding protein [Candidatus Nanopelagicales bacterium]